MMVCDVPVSTSTAVRFVQPIPGLAGLTDFRLEGLDDTGVLFTLQSETAPDVSLLLLAPWQFFPDYTPVLNDQDTDMLGLTSAQEALVFVVVTPGATAAASTVNLLAPIVLSLQDQVAMQVVLTGDDHPLRAPLIA